MWINNIQGEATPNGEKTKATFKRVENDLVKTGDVNIYDRIQSFAEQTDYTAILERMSRGDPVAQVQAVQILQENQGVQYGSEDRSTDLKSVYNAVIESQKVYNELGGKDKLGLTFNEFLAAGEIVSGHKIETPAATDAADPVKEGE